MAQREAHLTLTEDLQFRAATGSGHDVLLDSGLAGKTGGPSPVEMVLVALGGCGSMDVISILRKMRQDVTTYDVHVIGDRSDEHPKVFTSITMTHALAGNGIEESSVSRAITLSMTRYCPVFAMLSPTVPIRVYYTIHDAAGAPVAAGEIEQVPPPLE